MTRLMLVLGVSNGNRSISFKRIGGASEKGTTFLITSFSVVFALVTWDWLLLRHVRENALSCAMVDISCQPKMDCQSLRVTPGL